jgi:peroxiredoxin
VSRCTRRDDDEEALFDIPPAASDALAHLQDHNNDSVPVLPMKTKLFLAAAVVLVALSSPPRASAQPMAPPAELTNLIARVNAKLEDGKRTEADLAPELKEFDSLLAKHKGEKTEEVAQILFMEAMLYLQVLENTDKGAELIKQLQRDYPKTKPAQNADQILASIEKQAEAKKVQDSLAEGKPFPDFSVTDTAGKPLSIANFKGKVVLLDFWATWCGPCVHELPNVIKTYDTYHAKGFEVIGISLDKDRQKLASFTKEKKMLWPQYFDGLMWENKLAVKYGVNSIPATYLLDGKGMIIGKDLRGEALDRAVAKALAAK